MLGIAPLSSLPLSTLPAAAPAVAQQAFFRWRIDWPSEDRSAADIINARRAWVTPSGPVVVSVPFTRNVVPWEWYADQPRIQSLPPRLLYFPASTFVPFVRTTVPWEWYADQPRVQPPPRQLLYNPFAPPIITTRLYPRVEDPPDYSFWTRRWNTGAPWVKITGTTRDAAGAALPACTVKLFRTADDVKVDQTVSDGSGNFSFTMIATTATFYIVAYLAGGPDREGGTVNSLLPS